MIHQPSGKSSMPRKIHLTTLGCSKNAYDSEILLGQLSRAAVKIVDDPREAEAIIINTCGFISPAKQESIEAILEAEKIKKTDPEKKIIVCGCLSQRYAPDLRRSIPAVDAYFGTEDYGNILSFLKIPLKSAPEFLYEQRVLTTPSHYAYLKISEGCNHTCAFCAIPGMRGPHRSRRKSAILAEARQLVARGVKELIIISQDTTFYGIDLYKKQELISLLTDLEKIPGLRWIRLHYLYPTSFPAALIDFMAASRKVVPYLDMPVQHISNRMLKIMRRGGKTDRIKRIFTEAREKIADLTLRTTLIVGHPGETETDFRELVEFVREMRFERLGIFQYSHEEGTAAFSLNDLPEAVKRERYRELMEVQREISLKNNERWINRAIEVVIDEVMTRQNLAMGRSAGDSPEIDNTVAVKIGEQATKPGEFITVQIQDATEYELYGQISRNQIENRAS